MSTQLDIFAELSKPFPSSDIEWRVQQSGIAGSGKVWAMVLAYVTNRAIQNRLDEVCGPMGWKNEYQHTDKGVMCGISIWCSERKEWVTKWDGAENTDIEAMKGGLSGSMKRSAVQWGIGRYLYKLESGFADCFDGKQGKHRGQAKPKGGGRPVYFSWNPPRLPEWALPEEEKNQNQNQAAGHNREEYLANRRNQQVQQQQQNGHVTETPENAYRKREKQQQQQSDYNQQSHQESRQPQNAQQQFNKDIAESVRDRRQQVVNQRPVQTPDSFEPPRQPVITPQQFKRLQGALQMAQLDEIQFCTIAGNIRTLGELTQDRFDGAMARVQKEAQRMAH